MTAPQPTATSYYDEVQKPRYVIQEALAMLREDGSLLFASDKFSEYFPDALIKAPFLDSETTMLITSSNHRCPAFTFKDGKAIMAVACNVENRIRVFLYLLDDSVFSILDFKQKSARGCMATSELLCSPDPITSTLVGECTRTASALKQCFQSAHSLSDRSPYPLGSLLDGWRCQYIKEAPYSADGSISIDIGALKSKAVKTSAEGFCAMLTAVCDALLQRGAAKIEITAKTTDTGIILRAHAKTQGEFGIAGSAVSFDSVLSGEGTATAHTLVAFGASKKAFCTLEYSRDIFSEESFTAEFTTIDIGTLGFKAVVPFEKLRVGVRSARLVCGI